MEQRQGIEEFIKYDGDDATLAKIKALYTGSTLYIVVRSKTSWKSNRQNRLFHGLLTIFWESGCASFADYDDMRGYYKRVAGLVKLVRKDNKTTEREGSWSDATSAGARRAIDTIMHDMDESNVLGSSRGKQYEDLLRKIGEWQEDN